MAKPFSNKFYHSAAWQHTREMILARDYYICQECGKANCTTVHHINELTPGNINDPRITLNPDNLETICRDCHDKIHNRFQPSKNKKQREAVYDNTGHIIAAKE